MESLLPDVVDNLQPYWADFNASGASKFGDYLVKRSEEVCEALLTVTDKHAESSQRPTILKAYRAVRGGAAKHVVAAPAGGCPSAEVQSVNSPSAARRSSTMC
jgi:hypothetical protein